MYVDDNSDALPLNAQFGAGALVAVSPTLRKVKEDNLPRRLRLQLLTGNRRMDLETPEVLREKSCVMKL